MAESAGLQAFQKGIIRWYSISKQYGFVLTDGGQQIFFHHSSIPYPGAGSNCDHNRGICARAMSLLSDEKRFAEQHRQANEEFNTHKFEMLLEGELVMFRVANTDRGPVARSVKRAA